MGLSVRASVHLTRELFDTAEAVVLSLCRAGLVAIVATVIRVKARVLERKAARVERAVRRLAVHVPPEGFAE